MKTIGIVAEYNPFHLGHAYHIRESRRLAGEDAAVVAVMSGDFVQRGEAAVYSKYARAEAACRCGADLVAELPLPWALSSAEGFAFGAVSLLSALGAETLSFGCEDAAALPELNALAELMTESGFTEEVRAMLKQNPAQSFAAARQLCAENRLGRPLPLLREPNSILAIEYLKAVRLLRLSMEPLAVTRKGAGHDERGESLMPSASELRSRLRIGREIADYLPPEAESVFQQERKAGRTALSAERQNILMLSRLRFLDEDAFELLPDAGEGLGRRVYRAVRSESSYEAVLYTAATRRYPLARISRLCVCAALGVQAEDTRGLPPYARILAFNGKGRTLLNRIAERENTKGERTPLVVKPARVHQLSIPAQRVFELGARAHDFYTLFHEAQGVRSCGEDWRQGPAVC